MLDHAQWSAVCRTGAGLDSRRRRSLHRRDGLLHTPAGRPLMRLMGMSCPARSVSPEAAEALRQRGVRGLRGVTAAPARPALGLELDGARLADVQSWAAARGGLCTVRARPSAPPTCGHIGDYDEVTFGFAPDGRLVSVATLRARLPGRGAAGSFEAIRQVLSSQLGEGGLAGEATAAALEGGPLHTARLQVPVHGLSRDGDRHEFAGGRRPPRTIRVGAGLSGSLPSPRRAARTTPSHVGGFARLRGNRHPRLSRAL